MERERVSMPTYYVIVLEDKCSDVAAKFLIEKLSAILDDNGNRLEIRQQPPTSACPKTILHITASDELIWKIAEYLEIKKPDRNNYVRKVSMARMNEFPESGRIGPLELSDVQRCILYAMEKIYFSNKETSIPWHEDLKIIEGAPLLDSYHEHGLVSFYAVHDSEEKDKLLSKWTYSVFANPLNEIRSYFGESIALYFSFLELYTTFLCVVAVLGVTEFYLNNFTGVNHIHSNVIFSLCYMVGLAVFLECWKRKSNTHAFLWGTGGELRHKPPRPEFRGKLAKNPATGKVEMMYPIKKTWGILATVSLPITFGCLIIAFLLMILYFKAREYVLDYLVDQKTGEVRADILSQVYKVTPTVVYSILIGFFNKKYTSLATFLTRWENHRTQEQYESHLIAKLVLFQFVNTFCALFYVAFYLQDLEMLRSYITTMLITMQILNQIEESILPVLLRQPKTIKAADNITGKLNQVLGTDDKGSFQERSLRLPEASESDIKTVTSEYSSDPYESTFYDFMELWIQFGYAFLFLAVYPLASVFALVNNLLELPIDRYKLCKLARKPHPLAIRNNSAWFTAFRLLAIISIATNCALIALDLRKTAGAKWSDAQWIMLLVSVEHVLLAIMGAIEKLIPDVPGKVKLQIDQTNNYLKMLSVANHSGEPKIHFGAQRIIRVRNSVSPNTGERKSKNTTV